MVTLYRPAMYPNARASKWSGLSTDSKPTDVENGAEYYAIDTGKIYRYDAENSTWYEGVSSD